MPELLTTLSLVLSFVFGESSAVAAELDSVVVQSVEPAVEDCPSCGEAMTETVKITGCGCVLHQPCLVRNLQVMNSLRFKCPGLTKEGKRCGKDLVEQDVPEEYQESVRGWREAVEKAKIPVPIDMERYRKVPPVEWFFYGMCPSCNRVVQRNGGCESMVCGRDTEQSGDQLVPLGCGAEFKWPTAQLVFIECLAAPALEARVSDARALTHVEAREAVQAYQVAEQRAEADAVEILAAAEQALERRAVMRERYRESHRWTAGVCLTIGAAGLIASGVFWHMCGPPEICEPVADMFSPSGSGSGSFESGSGSGSYFEAGYSDSGSTGDDFEAITTSTALTPSIAPEMACHPSCRSVPFMGFFVGAGCTVFGLVAAPGCWIRDF